MNLIFILFLLIASTLAQNNTTNTTNITSFIDLLTTTSNSLQAFNIILSIITAAAVGHIYYKSSEYRSECCDCLLFEASFEKSSMSENVQKYLSKINTQV